MSGYIGSKTSVTLVDGYTQAEADAEFVDKAGDTMTGGLTVGGSFTSLGIDDNATSTAVTIDSSGRVTMPYQPAFMARPDSATDSGLVVTSWTTANANDYNIGNHLVSDRFTAPIAGKYLFSFSGLYLRGTTGWSRIWTLVNGVQVIDGLDLKTTDSGNVYNMISYSVILNLSVGDYVQIQADDEGSNGYLYANPYTRWAGYLLG